MTNTLRRKDLQFCLKTTEAAIAPRSVYTSKAYLPNTIASLKALGAVENEELRGENVE